MSSFVSTLKGKLFGEKVANSETRHTPFWFPSSSLDKRWLGERFAIMTLPPYKPPFRRHTRMKGWVCAGPHNIFHLVVIAEVDLDERTVDIDAYR